MRQIQVKPFFFRLLRRIPMPVIAILVGLMAGLAVWGVLEEVQSRQVKKIIDEELRSRLDMRSRESLILFEQYLSDYAATARLIANNRRLGQYLEPRFWERGEEVEPVVFRRFSPDWLPDFFERNALAAPSHALLVDTEGCVREIYQAGVAPVPDELAQVVEKEFLDTGEARWVFIRLAERFYLLLSEPVEDASGYEMGSLVVLVVVDDDFLAASQRGLSSEEAVVALVDSGEQRILVSTDPAVLTPGTLVDEWSDTYLITSQSLPHYQGSDWNPVLVTFIPHDTLEKMSRHVRLFERRQRGIAAVVFIAAFTLIIYLVSSRLNKVLRRMSRFSRQALGIEQPGLDPGANQLVLLEEWTQEFTALVLKAREEMSRRHESEMRESEALKAAIMEASLDSIVTLDRKGAIIEFNPTAERTLGSNRREVIGGSFTGLFLTAAARGVFLRLLEGSRRARREGREHFARGELTARRADGFEIPMEISIVPINLEAKHFYTLFMHDITKRKEAEREILSLARFVGESPSPILRVDPAGALVYANHASEPLLAAWDIGMGRPLPPRWSAEVREAVAAGHNRERETQLDGQVYSLLFAPIRELGYVNIYARDITAVRRAEQEARQHQAELAHVCRLSTMGEVATGMAHELNQPLAAIVNFANGCSRRIQSGVGEPQELVDAMGQIAAQAQRASEIIRRLRALVGKQPPMRLRVDLNQLVREVCSFVKFETGNAELTPDLDLEPGGIPVEVDVVQIEQVLLNLVRNGLDALKEVAPEARRLTIRTRRVNAEAEVAVEDTGPGIAPARMPHLFDPFFTTKETGMGMGLTISQTILESHGGRIWVESPVGGGAVFYMRLAVAAAAGLEAVR